MSLDVSIVSQSRAVRRGILGSILGLMGGSLLGLSGCAEPTLVEPEVLLRPAYGTLEELFQTEIVNIGLEELGYRVVSGSEVDYDTIHRAIANNYLDYTTVHWNPLHNSFLEANGGEANLVRAGTLVENALQGYAIDQVTARAYQINSLAQLKDPQIAALFDTDGNGKANLVGCPPGWGCRSVIEHHLDAYGLRDTVEHDSDNYFALIDQVIKNQAAGDAVLYYTWTPLWVSNVLTPGEQVEWLEVPYTALPQSYDPETQTTVDGKNLGFAVNQIEILASREFLDANPTAQKFFERVRVPAEAVSLQNQSMQSGENTPADIRNHAQAWINENRALFDSWIAAAQ
ncbi:MAG: glycine betaine/L-proline ABC transporter substrate-binding protein ProX [Cyanobacteria bacterium J06614_10]